jgi:hypothetical protein
VLGVVVSTPPASKPCLPSGSGSVTHCSGSCHCIYERYSTVCHTPDFKCVCDVEEESAQALSDISTTTASGPVDGFASSSHGALASASGEVLSGTR